MDTSHDLRQRRLDADRTLVAAAQYLGVWPVAVRRIEAGTSRDTDLRNRYLEWLETQAITKV
ncbi:hypothetical protein QF038_001942 [Pseudarthrobacter sp. W1I19]|uniref:hypothetical protein n=1 Tax=Pseudarthrobacter sp. W1I19 TaxID=3042288 RepID=UPI00278486AA|nr:hypothetical protein [Pseudarthrobacter sp. W1I19]MDQ0923434.1 hypothetical protein [Pseudarthrobacter sp. W1I19]